MYMRITFRVSEEEYNNIRQLSQGNISQYIRSKLKTPQHWVDFGEAINNVYGYEELYNFLGGNNPINNANSLVEFIYEQGDKDSK